MRALIVCALIVAARASGYSAAIPAVGARFSYGYTAPTPLYGARSLAYAATPAATYAGYGYPAATAYNALPYAYAGYPYAAAAAPAYGYAAAAPAYGYAAAAPAYGYAAAPVATSAQHHSQDELGQYNYGYSDVNSAKSEVKTADGVVRGSYSYRDAYGLPQKVYYVSDALGFRVAATNLPVGPAQAGLVGPAPVADTPEVAAAKAAHFAAHAEARARAAAH